MEILETGIAQLWGFLQSNAFASGGVVVMLLGFAVAELRRLPLAIVRFARRRWLTWLEVPGHDEVYHWFKQWLFHHPSTRRFRNLRATSFIPNDVYHRDDQELRQVILSPGIGVHLLRHRGRWIWLTLEQDDKENRRSQPEASDTLKLTMLGGDRQFLLDLIAEARSAMMAASRVGTRIYLASFSSWSLHDIREPRSLESLILEEGLLEQIKGDIDWFLASKDWYHTRGLFWKRGYLLYGEPGNGKTSLVFTLAGVLGYHVCCLNLASDALSDDTFQSLVADLPPRSFLLLEEVDAALPNRAEASVKSEQDKNGSRLSLGCVLNVLDGYVSREGSLIFMTTNYPDRLDPALIRPGRMDRHFHLGPATPGQIARMFQHFYPEWTDVLGFVDGMPTGLSMAAIQAACLENPADPRAALRSIRQRYEPKTRDAAIKP